MADNFGSNRSTTSTLIARSANDLYALAAILNDGVVTINPNGRIVWVNDAALRLTGYSKSDLIGHSFDVVFPQSSPHRNHKPLNSGITPLLPHPISLVLGGELNATYESTIHDAPLAFSIFHSLHPAQAPMITVCAIAIITKSRGRLPTPDDPGVAKMQLLGQLTMTIAHDFNNALTSINCNTEMAAETIIDFTQARCAEETEHLHEALEFLSMVTKTSKSAEAFVRQLLAYARQQQLVRGPLNLNDPIRSTSKLFRKVLGECVSVNLILDERLPRVYAERSQIEGVLMNLIVNARDAMPNGGSLTIESSIATIDARFIRRRPWARTGVFVKLSVSDTGIGMDSETLDKIFTLYFTTKENGKGNGLGLPSVYGIIRQHGGYLDVTSAIGHGTQFDLYLPPATADQLTQVTTVRSEHPINTLLPAGKFILIAEADSTVRRLFQQIIRRAGAVPISVSDGERALEIYRRMTERNTPIDVAIIDIGLPGLDGRDVYRRIKLCDPTAAVLLISGYGMRYTESQSTPEEGYEFLHKPFDGFQLLDRINSLITQREEALANHIADGEILPISAVETVF